MKQFSTFIFYILSCFFLLLSSSYAQTATMSVVGKPQKSSSGFSGVRDVNGRICAMIKVISDMDGFSYDSNNGVVKVDDKPGEDRVYLQPDERVMEIYKSGYEPLKLILSEYGIQLHPKDVWQIKLKGSAKTGDLLPVTFLVQPQDAVIIVDGKSTESGQPLKLSKGSHRLRISKEGFKTVTENISVSESKVLFNYSLSEVELQQVLIKSVPVEARIYLDNVDEGLTDRGVWKYPGQYQLKLSKTGYVEINETIKVSEIGNNTFSYNLSKNSGSLKISCSPKNALVLINKKDYSNRSNIELAPGRYKIEISKTGYHPQSETVSIKRGGTLNKSYVLTAKTGRLQFNIQPLSAKVTLKQNGRVVQSWTGMKYIKNLQVGRYDLECSASGYGSETKRITIEEQSTAVLDVQLKKGSSTAGGMVFIKGGTFQMGDTFNEGSDYEKPVHTVTVNDFYMSKYEVTNVEYIKFLNDKKVSSNGSYGGKEYIDMDDEDCAIGYRNGKFYFKGSSYANDEKCPVIEVTWYGSDAYCKWAGGRLPTEAEWEYAAREGGKKVRFGNGKDIADPAEINFDGRSKYKKSYSQTGVYRKKTMPVGSFKPNALGLYDMSGNVWEWCSDWYEKNYYRNSPQNNPRGPSSGSHRVLRGGSWSYKPLLARAAFRNYGPPNISSLNLGFRIVKTR